MILAGMVAALLTACNGPQPADNGAIEAPAAEQGSDGADTIANLVINDAGTAEAAPAATPSKSCEAEIGTKAATELAKRCRFVSPATRPPCHPANPCEMIQDEIDRSCGMFGDEDRPAECKAAE